MAAGSIFINDLWMITYIFCSPTALTKMLPAIYQPINEDDQGWKYKIDSHHIVTKHLF